MALRPAVITSVLLPLKWNRDRRQAQNPLWINPGSD